MLERSIYAEEQTSHMESPFLILIFDNLAAKNLWQSLQIVAKILEEDKDFGKYGTDTGFAETAFKRFIKTELWFK